MTVKDIALAHRERMTAAEHLKRWTTPGMGTDQGKTASVTALAVMAELTGKTLLETGTAVHRPPYTPVTLGVLGGGDTGTGFRPTRLTPTHAWAVAQGATFVEAGPWMRAPFWTGSLATRWHASRSGACATG